MISVFLGSVKSNQKYGAFIQFPAVYSLSGKTFHLQIAQNPEAATYGLGTIFLECDEMQ